MIALITLLGAGLIVLLFLAYSVFMWLYMQFTWPEYPAYAEEATGEALDELIERMECGSVDISTIPEEERADLLNAARRIRRSEGLENTAKVHDDHYDVLRYMPRLKAAPEEYGCLIDHNFSQESPGHIWREGETETEYKARLTKLYDGGHDTDYTHGLHIKLNVTK